MTMLLANSWDGAFSANDPGWLGSIVTNGGTSSASHSTARKRTGARSLRLVSTATTDYVLWSAPLSAAQTELYVQIGFLYDEDIVSMASDQTLLPLLVFGNDSGGNAGAVCINPTTNILSYVRPISDQAQRDFTDADVTTIATGTNALSAKVWYAIECYIMLHDSTGAVEVKLDGVSELSATGQDTIAGSGPMTVTDIRLTDETGAGTGWTGHLYFDDLVVNTTAGSYNNSWPDKAQVETLYIDGPGALSQWSLYGAGSFAAAVGDTETGNPDGDTIMTHEHMATEKTLGTLSDLAFLADILAFCPVINSANDVDGIRGFKVALRSGGTNYTPGATITPGETYQWNQQIFEIDPDTALPWTGTDIDALELGFEVQ